MVSTLAAAAYLHSEDHIFASTSWHAKKHFSVIITCKIIEVEGAAVPSPPPPPPAGPSTRTRIKFAWADMTRPTTSAGSGAVETEGGGTGAAAAAKDATSMSDYKDRHRANLYK